MIRPTRGTDFDALLALATHQGSSSRNTSTCLRTCCGRRVQTMCGLPMLMPMQCDADADVPVGVAYMAPEKMTRGTWNLYWIAIAPDHQRQGRGKALLEHVQNWLIDKGQRILLVETAGVDDFDYVRKFYADNGFEAEARIRDFYDAGVDKVVFRKSLC